tara:strand:+ start:9564 stop:10016 length:453 start_codon:yes stop_codon:yes gene_type:complete
MILEFVHADLFQLEADTIVCPVNCDGTMGNGLALAFKFKYPDDLFNQYHYLCGERKLNPGHSWLYRHPYKNVLCFATKDRWRNDSKLEWISRGLYACLDNLPRLGVRHIGFPLLGCGKGNLNKHDVIELFREVFDPDIVEGIDLKVTVCL